MVLREKVNFKSFSKAQIIFLKSERPAQVPDDRFGSFKVRIRGRDAF